VVRHWHWKILNYSVRVVFSYENFKNSSSDMKWMTPYLELWSFGYLKIIFCIGSSQPWLHIESTGEISKFPLPKPHPRPIKSEFWGASQASMGFRAPMWLQCETKVRAIALFRFVGMERILRDFFFSNI
jgi:hypothetical protein